MGRTHFGSIFDRVLCCRWCDAIGGRCSVNTVNTVHPPSIIEVLSSILGQGHGNLQWPNHFRMLRDQIQEGHMGTWMDTLRLYFYLTFCLFVALNISRQAIMGTFQQETSDTSEKVTHILMYFWGLPFTSRISQ